ncbi:hypothetical protein [Streptomyces flaveolus]|uniref:hypothetical protein n=1 Tax=Streptomyces flaveolus TaxID=67297 RepID=UPI003322D065
MRYLHRGIAWCPLVVSEKSPQLGFAEGDGLGQGLLVTHGQGFGTEACVIDHRTERGCPLGAEQRLGHLVAQHFTRGIGVEAGYFGGS